MTLRYGSMSSMSGVGHRTVSASRVLLAGGPRDGDVIEVAEPGVYLQTPHPDSLPSFDRPETLDAASPWLRVLTYVRTAESMNIDPFGWVPVYRLVSDD